MTIVLIVATPATEIESGPCQCCGNHAEKQDRDGQWECDDCYADRRDAERESEKEWAMGF